MPPFQLAGGAGRVGQGFFRAILASKNPWFTGIVDRWNKSASGLMHHEVGHAFQRFFKQLMPGERENVGTGVGKHTVDFVWNGWVLEMKTSRPESIVDPAQLAAAAEFARKQNLTLVYYSLRKPTQGEIKKLQDAGANLVYLFD